ncbi:hypothetical protein ACS0TY_029546 [Phlomoides rotata]
MNMESWKPKVTKSSKANPHCKKHPKHTQSPGVCSICLGEKLSIISYSSDSYSSSSSKGARSASSFSSSSSSSSISSLSSSDASSCSSPMGNYTYRVSVEGRNSMRVFKKSRSMAFARKEEDFENGKKINNGGFWSKLLPRSNKKLMHSKTMQIERVAAAVH